MITIFSSLISFPMALNPSQKIDSSHLSMISATLPIQSSEISSQFSACPLQTFIMHLRQKNYSSQLQQCEISLHLHSWQRKRFLALHWRTSSSLKRSKVHPQGNYQHVHYLLGRHFLQPFCLPQSDFHGCLSF
ncbi:hypothetical protein FGO68_gene12919 [Halteria grandinella]|uniref:Uncharacterized protein n=1 Tax=Halteria grandinella TaxID=5974 RepID=A0A8J8NP40_HALGN|nr:hypothetical protein FGO68_gene12919 [Halteria grandinella]